jgi:hypothetical protein
MDPVVLARLQFAFHRRLPYSMADLQHRPRLLHRAAERPMVANRTHFVTDSLVVAFHLWRCQHLKRAASPFH